MPSRQLVLPPSADPSGAHLGVNNLFSDPFESFPRSSARPTRVWLGGHVLVQMRDESARQEAETGKLLGDVVGWQSAGIVLR